MRDHAKLRAFELADEVAIIPVLGYLIRSLRSPNRLQSKQPE